MKGYKKWTSAQRVRGLNLVNKAIKDGTLPQAKVCKYCQGNIGIHYHQENYDDPLNMDNLHAVCFRCHILLFHCSDKEIKAEYLSALNSGIRFKPVYRRQDFLAGLKNKNIMGGT